jgi:hypothetical protein
MNKNKEINSDNKGLHLGQIKQQEQFNAPVSVPDSGATIVLFAIALGVILVKSFRIQKERGPIEGSKQA